TESGGRHRADAEEGAIAVDGLGDAQERLARIAGGEPEYEVPAEGGDVVEDSVLQISSCGEGSRAPASRPRRAPPWRAGDVLVPSGAMTRRVTLSALFLSLLPLTAC